MIKSKEVLHIAKLARIKLADEELEKFPKDFSSILEYFAILKEVDVSNVQPMTHSVLLESVLRQDTARKEPEERVQKLLRMMPATKDGFLKVKAVFAK